MSLFGYLRQSLKSEKIEAKLKDNEWHEVKEEMERKKRPIEITNHKNKSYGKYRKIAKICI
jgi:hypothetical protein